MTSTSDVMVIGGGPCGSAAAARLAKDGASVTVFEEHRQIGAPRHCTGHLSINGLNRLKLLPLPKSVVENTISGAMFHSPKGDSFSIRFPAPVTCVVNRTLFDQLISKIAQASGATYELGSRVESLIVKDGFVSGGNVKGTSQTEKVQAKIVIDGEGIPSRLLRQVGLRTLDRRKIVNAVNADVDGAVGLEPDLVEVFTGSEYAPGFYAWLIPLSENKARIGLATKENNPRDLLPRLMHKHPAASAKLHRAKILQTSFHPIPLGGPIPTTYSNGFLAVGDAASQVKPTTGGGVILGMTCAETAAQVTLESLQKNDYSAEFLSLYQTRCRRTMGFDMNVMLRVRRMLDALSDRRIDQLINLCTTLELEKIMQNVKDIDFQGKSFLQALKSPRMVALLGCLVFFYLTANP
jgi:digeranylgeranylglycerophospholipid reductase